MRIKEKTFLIFMFLILILCGSCAIPSKAAQESYTDTRFSWVTWDKMGREPYLEILLDKETGVRYLLVQHEDSIAIVKLEE